MLPVTVLPRRPRMSSPAFIEVPGLNFDWLNLDTQQGMEIHAGRRGLTLEQINQMSYGVDSRAESGIPVFSPRGSAPDPRSPRHARQYRNKADVWSESAMLLYEEANQRQWSSATDIPWDEVKPMSDDLEMARCTLCTFGTQIMDESRHLDVFRKRTLVNGGGMVDAGFGAINLLSVDDFTEMTALLH